MLFKQLLTLAILTLSIATSFAAERNVNLTVSYQSVNYANKPAIAIAVNHQIPAPTLHFKEGDRITLNVYNKLDKETAIHWHGMILPWQMDGVLGITQHGIQPGHVFHYQFTLRQAGTYWYHAHAGLQEQQGLYGALIIDPIKKPAYHYTKEAVVVLSDWSNSLPENILANLKKDGDYYSPRFPLQPSLSKFIHDYQLASAHNRLALIDDYKMMQHMRMSIYDFSDVAYDAFLLNGHPNTNPWVSSVNVGDIVRLRFIGAGGSTIFHVKIPGTTMQMVQADGNDIKPYTVNDFTIAPGETYDVLVHIQQARPYIIYAESQDTVGAAYGALVTAPHQSIPFQQVTPFPEPIPSSREMMNMMMAKMNQGTLPASPASRASTMSMSDMDMSSMDMSSMDMSSMHHAPSKHLNQQTDHTMSMTHTMQNEPAIIGDAIAPGDSHFQTTFGTKYQNMTAAVKTNNPNLPIAGVIKMELFGYMGRYMWFINGIPEQLAKPIVLNPAKRYRFIFINHSMMHHPMHIHGHWFIFREGKNDYDPLLHTIDVPPGATITADLDTDASGQWLFHCHLIYHMMSGMSRVFQYSTLLELTQNEIKPEHIIKETPYTNRPIVRVDEVRPIDPALVMHPMAHTHGLWFASFLDIGADPFHNVQRLTYKGLYGSDYNKLELFADDVELNKGTIDDADLDIFYWHVLDQFWALKGGINYFYRPSGTPYWQPGIGIEGLMPYFIDTNIRTYYHSGSAKLDAELSRDTQITNNFFIRAGIRSIIASKSVSQAEIGTGLNQMRYTLRPYYRLMPGLDIYTEYEHEQDYGAFKRYQHLAGEQTMQNTVTLGLTILF